ncbi:hypothetical protein F4808DRAFT_442676 [Astrocystis sublimbata]|nr:hypothetical protein F4808DRAFT_442676 [Astrocystis sublimbata]
MSKELNELRNQGLKPGRTSTASPDDSGFSADQTGGSPSAIPVDDYDLAISTVEIGGVVISAQTAIEAFRIYARLYHPKLPILVSININTVYESSPFLFWAIIMIVSERRQTPAFQALFNQIAKPFRDMVNTEALKAPLPLQSIRALLLLCTWPMPVGSQRMDPSWIHSGIALNSALFLSLNRPGPAQFPRPSTEYTGTPLERISTWLGCFYVSNTLSMHLGLPAVIDNPSQLAAVGALLQEFPMPREFECEVRLQNIITGFCNLFSHSANDGGIDSPILHLLERDLDGLRTQYPDQWPRMLEYNTLVAKLQTYVLVISRDRIISLTRDILLKLSFSTSLRIIHLANLRHTETPSEDSDEPALVQEQALPKSYFKGLAFTTAFLLRYFGLNVAASAEEQQLAANHVVLAYTIFTAVSTTPLDEWGRAATSFENLCKRGPVSFDSQAPARGDRFGFAILIEAIRVAGLKRGDDSTHSTEPPPPPTIQSDPDPVPSVPSVPSVMLDMPINHAPDLWSMDMMFPDQFWHDPSWDAMNLPFADAQYPHRFDG